ncbi:MAG: UPF0489 family protein [bacterium]|nr:UPF0489 family protein [bacterium]
MLNWYQNDQNPWYIFGRVLKVGQGNNAFSLPKKADRLPLTITPLCLGSLDELRIGGHVAFQDFDGDASTGSASYRWIECFGLESAILCLDYPIPLYAFDNHNHAFYGWCEGMKTEWFQKGATLVHLDAHFDDAEPASYQVSVDDLEDVWRYTNEVLQIATFIQPALRSGVFSKVLNFVESSDFDSLPQIDGEVVLNIDLDVFCEDMSHISWRQKVDMLKHYLPQTKLITMATSPFFIEQQKAIEVAKRVVGELF